MPGAPRSVDDLYDPGYAFEDQCCPPVGEGVPPLAVDEQRGKPTSPMCHCTVCGRKGIGWQEAYGILPSPPISQTGNEGNSVLAWISAGAQ
jgi:hypothetical protein